MDPIVEKGIFVGYDKTLKAYRIYIPALRKIVVRQDMRFEEDRAFRRSQELGHREPSMIQQHQQQSSSQVTGGQSIGGTSVTLTGPSVSSS